MTSNNVVEAKTLALIWEKGMERNKKNNFKLFFPSLVWEF